MPARAGVPLASCERSLPPALCACGEGKHERFVIQASRFVIATGLHYPVAMASARSFRQRQPGREAGSQSHGSLRDRQAAAQEIRLRRSDAVLRGLSGEIT
jgi:hypothetical protein